MRLRTFYFRDQSAFFMNCHHAPSILQLLKMGHTSTKFGFVTMTNSHTSDAVLEGRRVLAKNYHFWSPHAQTSCLYIES